MRLDRGRDLARELLGDLGCAHAQDGELALEVGVRDPVVEATALERVVHVAGAVRRDDHERRAPSAWNVPELRDRHRVVGEDLEQERLELVVGAVDLVDQQHRRRHRAERVGLVGDRAQQRPLHEEALRVELVLDDLAAARFDRAQVQQLAGVVPLVDRLRRRRCPRSTAAAPARRRSSAASTLATSVLPTPASPSSSNGRCSRMARKIAVARPSSAR